MKLFDIREIGIEIEATAGTLDGCDLCGHCRVLRRSLGARAASGCHAADEPTPLDVLLHRETAPSPTPHAAERRAPGEGRQSARPA